MRIDVNRDEFQTIIDALGGGVLKCERRTADQLRAKLVYQLKGGPPSPKGWAPIRSPRLDAHVKPDRRSNWAFHKQRKQPKPQSNGQVKKQLSADEILAGL